MRRFMIAMLIFGGARFVIPAFNPIEVPPMPVGNYIQMPIA